MNETKKGVKTRMLLEKLLTNYPSQAALARASNYSVSYISYLRRGVRLASDNFCQWAKNAHPEHRRLCASIQRSKYNR